MSAPRKTSPPISKVDPDPRVRPDDSIAGECVHESFAGDDPDDSTHEPESSRPCGGSVAETTDRKETRRRGVLRGADTGVRPYEHVTGDRDNGSTIDD